MLNVLQLECCTTFNIKTKQKYNKNRSWKRCFQHYAISLAILLHDLINLLYVVISEEQRSEKIDLVPLTETVAKDNKPRYTSRDPKAVCSGQMMIWFLLSFTMIFYAFVKSSVFLRLLNWVKNFKCTVFDLITAPALITPPPWHLTLFSPIIAHLTIFFLTFYFIFTYYRLLDDLLALVVENKFT